MHAAAINNINGQGGTSIHDHTSTSTNPKGGNHCQPAINAHP
jgi:hypothetical protein